MFSANSSQVSEDRLYVEDVFSTYLYTGNGSTQTITNGIDLAGKGGLVWVKERAGVGFGHYLSDSARGVTQALSTDTTDQQFNRTTYVNAFNSNGFSMGSGAGVNYSGSTFASWTFRKAPKFFDVVTYTGNGANRNIAHSLGVAPGCIIVKRTDAAADWQVYHRSNANTEYMVLNTTAAKATGTTRWNSTTPTATEFTVGTDTTVNASGGTYVAYLFAHDTTSDGIIQCGSYTGNGSSFGPTVSLDWEPQWLLIKRASAAEDWVIYDNMRGVPTDGIDAQLSANLSNAEQLAQNRVDFTATGFVPRQGYTTTNASGDTYIYIAIRRGPMRTPTSGTSVFSVASTSSSTLSGAITTGFPTDWMIALNRAGDSGGNGWYNFDRLRGGWDLQTTLTAAESYDYSSYLTWANNTAFNYSGGTYNLGYYFKRAPSFFDEVCYTGTGSATTFNHNLGVAPELMIVKRRDSSGNWLVYSASEGATKSLFLNLTDPSGTYTTYWNSTAPTASVFTVGTTVDANGSGGTYVARLFASCPGVSKVGSYTGNGSSQTINCGFAAGARFVMIKRADSAGDWYVWDTSRGIISANDPHMSLNSRSAEVTTDDSIDPDNSGFIVNQVAATNINVSSATYIYLAVA